MRIRAGARRHAEFQAGRVRTRRVRTGPCTVLRGGWGTLPLSGSTVVGVAVFLRTERAAALRMMLDWRQIDAGQHVRDGDRARYSCTMTDRVLECPDARVRSGEVVPIGMVGLVGLLALRSSRREIIHGPTCRPSLELWSPSKESR